MGVFGDWAAKYYESGYSVIPLNRKRPVISDWSEFCKVKPAQEEFDQLENEYPNMDIGVCLGPASGIVAFDFDYDGPEAARINDILKGYLPSTPVKKVGQKGWTAFYRYNGEPSWSVNRFGKTDGGRFADFLSDGKQTVLPPSIHPITGKAYKWTTQENLLSINPVDLPELPKDFKDKITFLANWDPIKEPFIFEQKSGRHDTIVGFVWNHVEKIQSLDDLAKLMVEFDAKEHKQPYFTDKTYWRGKDPIDCAKSIAKRCIKTVENKKAQRGEKWEFGQTTNGAAKIGYPSKDSGFYANALKGKIMVSTPQYQELAAYLKAEENLKTLNDGTCYLYEDKKYSGISEQRLLSIIQGMTKNQAKPDHLRGFATIIKAESFYNYAGNNPVGLINLNNGVLNIKTRELKEHSPNIFFPYKINVDYNADAKCPEFIQFLKEVTNDEPHIIDLIGEMLGYTIYGGNPKFEKAFFIIGPPRSGKSTLLEVLKKLIKENYSSVPLNNINKPFSAVSLFGKLANIVSEIDPSSPIDTASFKMIVSGEPITAAYKGKDEFYVTPFCKLIVACNQNPNLNTKDGSIERRIIFINFPNEIDEDLADTSIKDLAFEHELSGILNFAVDGAIRLFESKKFSTPESHFNLLDQYKDETDSVRQWANENLKILDETSHSYFTRNLYDNFRFDMGQLGNKNIVNISNFGKRLERWKKDNYPPNLYVASARNTNAGMLHQYMEYRGKAPNSNL